MPPNGTFWQVCPVSELKVTVAGFVHPQLLPTEIKAVSLQPLFNHTIKYVPAALKLVTVVVGDVGVVIVAVPALPAPNVQVPVPVATIVAMSVVKHTTDWSVPAFGFGNNVVIVVIVLSQPPIVNRFCTTVPASAGSHVVAFTVISKLGNKVVIVVTILSHPYTVVKFCITVPA